MKQQFVVAVNDDSTVAFNATVKKLNTLPGVGWCHYMKGLWQITDADGVLTPAELLREIREALPDTMVIVFEIKTGSTWNGWVPQKMVDWIEENWE